VNYFNSNRGELSVVTDEVGPTKCYELAPEKEFLLKGFVYNWVKEPNGDISVRDDEEMEQLFCELNNEIVVVGQENKYYRTISSITNCLFGFELYDRSGLKVASHLKVYNSVSSREEIIFELKNELNSEGMHVFEHVLLRPRHTTPPAEYHFAIEINKHVLLRGLLNENRANDTIEQAILNFKVALNLFIPNDFKIREKEKDFTDEKTQYYFVLEVNDIVLGRSEIFYCEEALAAEDMEAVKALMFDLKLQIANEEEESIQEILEPYIVSRRSKSELEGEAFLPVPLLCNDEENVDCASMSDPYSFRITVVLPFWPERFNNPEFRNFLETSIRKETPSHIFPRICWLDACQMRELETYYKNWLATISLKNDHCNAVRARRNLVQILSNLKSKYPDVQLYDCEQENSDKNKVILDHSRLG